MVMEGDLSEIRPMVARGSIHPVRAQRPLPEVDVQLLKEETQKKVKALFAEVTKRPAAKIDVHEELSAYGIDSIIIGNLNLRLATVFGEMSKTVFFEYKTLADFTAFLIQDYPAQCVSWTGVAKRGATTPEGDGIVRAAENRPQHAPAIAANLRPSPAGEGRQEPIASSASAGLIRRPPTSTSSGLTCEQGRIASAKSFRALVAGWLLRPGRRSGRRAGQELQQMGRLHRSLRGVRSLVLQHLSPRDHEHGPAGEAVPARGLARPGETQATRAAISGISSSKEWASSQASQIRVQPLRGALHAVGRSLSALYILQLDSESHLLLSRHRGRVCRSIRCIRLR